MYEINSFVIELYANFNKMSSINFCCSHYSKKLNLFLWMNLDLDLTTIRKELSMKPERKWDEICIKFLSITAWELLFKLQTRFLSNCYGLFECKFRLIKIFDIPSWESELLRSHAVFCWSWRRWRSRRNRSCCRVTVIIVTILRLIVKNVEIQSLTTLNNWSFKRPRNWRWNILIQNLSLNL